MIQKSEDGYDYTLYTSDYSEIDGGQLDNPDISIYDAMNEILEDLDIEIPGHKDEIDYEELEEKVRENFAKAFEDSLGEELPEVNEDGEFEDEE